MLYILSIMSLVVHTSVCRKLTPAENAQLQQSCGYLKAGKSNGKAPVEEEVPYAVLLASYFDDSFSDIKYCSGTQISPRHILTAAHCALSVPPTYDNTAPKQKFVLANHYIVKLDSSCMKTSENRRDLNHTHYNVVKVFLPSHYAKESTHMDISIWELDRDIPVLEGISACIVDQSTDLQDTLMVTGYGIDDSDESGNSLLPTYFLSPFEASHGLIYSTAYNKSYHGAVDGDSGAGGIQFSNKSIAEVISVVTGAVPIELSNGVHPELHVDIREYHDWICYYTGVCYRKNMTDINKTKLPETYTWIQKKKKLSTSTTSTTPKTNATFTGSTATNDQNFL